MIRWIALDSWALMPFDIAGSTAGSSQNFASPLAQMTCTWIRLAGGEHLLGDPARLAAAWRAACISGVRSGAECTMNHGSTAMQWPPTPGPGFRMSTRGSGSVVHRLEAGADELDELVLHAGRAPQEPRTYDVLHPLRQVRAYVGTDLFDLGAAQRHHGASSTLYTRASCPIHRPAGAGASPTGPLTGRAGAPIRQVAGRTSRLYKGYR